jgi:serine/threonine protein kinase
MTLKVKTLLNNRYRIEEVLGQGGMGAVYRAKDENLGVQVAVKENLFTSDEYTRQFTREATILATLRHTNLPRVFDHFEITGQGQYLVMDYIEGEDLRQRMDRSGMLPEEEVIIIGAGICDALEYLHTRHPPIFHRDIKPGNIKINSEGEVYLVDFGLAKIAEGSQATTTGARAMTPGYSSPEQYGTARTDARSDVYSLGATIYAALTGSIPEDGLARAMEQADLTPVQKRNPKINRRLAQVVEKALAVHPEDRYQSTAEFKQGLLNANLPVKRQVEAGEITVVPPPEDVVMSLANGILPDSRPLTEPEIDGESSSRKRRKRRKETLRAIGLVLSAFVVLALFGVIWGSNGFFTYLAERKSTPTKTISKDAPTQTATLKVKPTGTLEPIVKLPTDEPALTSTLPAILVPASQLPTQEPEITLESPPYNWEIAFTSNRTGVPQIWLYSFKNQGSSQLTDERMGACQPSWSPNGTRLAYVSPCNSETNNFAKSSIYIMDIEHPEDPARLNLPPGISDPVWSPVDENILLFTRYIDANNTQIYRINLASSEMVQMTESETNHNFSPAWSRDGSVIAFISTRLAGFRIYLMPDEPGVEAVGLTRSGPNDNQYPNWSIDGQQIIFAQKPSDGTGIFSIFAVNLDMIGVSSISEYHEEHISVDNKPESDPEYSPDGGWIVLESWPDGDNHDIYIMKADGTQKQVLDANPAKDFNPTWRPQQP